MGEITKTAKTTVKKATATKTAPVKEVVKKVAAKAAPKKETVKTTVKKATATKAAPKKEVEKKVVAAKTAPKKEVVKKAVVKKTEEKKETVKVAVKKEPVVKTEEKKPAAKKATAVKPAVKKEAVKPAVKKEAVKKEVDAVRLKTRFKKEIVPLLMKEFNYKSVMQVPRLHKIVINIGVGNAAQNSKLLEESMKELAIISGQKPIMTKAKKSIASFKLREGMPIGCKVTLRGDRMYQFLDKLVNISMPRFRDFRGVSKNSFDGRGNYTLGIKEQIIFPEIRYDEVNVIRGMDVVLVTTANSDKEAFGLLTALGMPFTK